MIALHLMTSFEIIIAGSTAHEKDEVISISYSGEDSIRIIYNVVVV